jgi:hypothetical protein
MHDGKWLNPFHLFIYLYIYILFVFFLNHILRSTSMYWALFYGNQCYTIYIYFLFLFHQNKYNKIEWLNPGKRCMAKDGRRYWKILLFLIEMKNHSIWQSSLAASVSLWPAEQRKSCERERKETKSRENIKSKIGRKDETKGKRNTITVLSIIWYSYIMARTKTDKKCHSLGY